MVVYKPAHKKFQLHRVQSVYTEIRYYKDIQFNSLTKRHSDIGAQINLLRVEKLQNQYKSKWDSHVPQVSFLFDQISALHAWLWGPIAQDTRYPMIDPLLQWKDSDSTASPIMATMCWVWVHGGCEAHDKDPTCSGRVFLSLHISKCRVSVSGFVYGCGSMSPRRGSLKASLHLSMP